MDMIGSRIVKLRDINDITQVKLSQSIRVTKATMSKYENNISIPNAEVIGKIADILNTTTDYLVGRTYNFAPLDKNDKWFMLSDEEKQYVLNFQRLTDTNKIRIIERIDILLEDQSKKLLLGGTGNKNEMKL